jgi:hypothetical protein
MIKTVLATIGFLSLHHYRLSKPTNRLQRPAAELMIKVACSPVSIPANDPAAKVAANEAAKSMVHSNPSDYSVYIHMQLSSIA